MPGDKITNKTKVPSLEEALLARLEKETEKYHYNRRAGFTRNSAGHRRNINLLKSILIECGLLVPVTPSKKSIMLDDITVCQEEPNYQEVTQFLILAKDNIINKLWVLYNDTLAETKYSTLKAMKIGINNLNLKTTIL